ncbi:MAG: GntR family transcriptional regulator [Acutalibacteraceae bacterium]|nr:GntR family transcriptional regulator [Clostridiales bacterium]
MAWDFESDRSIYSQIIEHFELSILSGELLPGAKLDSVRELASQASVNPNTMQRALSELERIGLVYTQRTNGRFITQDLSAIENARNNFAKKHIIDFLNRMQSLGLNKAQIIDLIEKYYEEDLQ